MEPQMGVNPKIGGKPPKWMVYNEKPYEKMDDLGVPLFLETSKWRCVKIQLMIVHWTTAWFAGCNYGDIWLKVRPI